MFFETHLIYASSKPFACAPPTQSRLTLWGVAGESSPAEGVAAYWGGVFVAALSRFSLDTRSRAAISLRSIRRANSRVGGHFPLKPKKASFCAQRGRSSLRSLDKRIKI